MSNVEKIDKALFQVMLNSGHRYTGLLDKIGYVYWTQETIFFVKIYPPLFGKDHSPRFELGITGKPFFEEISQLEIPYYRNRGYLVVDKQKYNLKVISVAELELTNKSLYKQYHGGRESLKNDNIPPISNRLPLTTGTAKPQVKVPDEVLAVAKVGRTIDNHVGVYVDVLESLNIGGKSIPYIGNALAAFSIIDGLSGGDYISAAGELIIAVAGWYGVVWQIGKVIYESDNFSDYYYNSRLIHYKIAAMEYEKKSTNSNYKKMRKELKALSEYEEIYKSKKGRNN